MINYDIKANIIDIQKDTPQKTDNFLIDTNVLYWMTYTRASIPEKMRPLPYQVNVYPDYIKKALAIKSGLLRTELHLTELGYLIESSELEIMKYIKPNIKRKEFRHNYTTDYKTVVSEILASWGQIKTLTKTLEAKICELIGDAVMQRCNSQRADHCDLLTLEIMNRSGISKIITDDGDFSTIPGIQVFTSNRSVIKRAKTQKKLITR